MPKTDEISRIQKKNDENAYFMEPPRYPLPPNALGMQGLGLLPEGTIQATLALGSDDAKALVANLPTGVVEGEMECLKRCGIAY